MNQVRFPRLLVIAAVVLGAFGLDNRPEAIAGSPPSPDAGESHGTPATNPPKVTPPKRATPAPAAKPASPGEPAESKTKDEPAVISITGKPGHKSRSQSDHGDEPAGQESNEAVDEQGATKSEAPQPQDKPSKVETTSSLTAADALKLLKDGNVRWVGGKSTAPNSDASRRRETAENGQEPFVTVISCADSRCPVERLFDRGVGDVFVARVAGNVIGDHEAGTVEYGVEHLHTPLIVVMGHTSCGAVKAAVAGAMPGHNIDSLVAEITPAVTRARTANPEASPEQLLTLAVRENVYQSMFDLLKSSPMTAKFVGEGRVQLVGAVYDISTGKVEFLGQHPWQEQLLSAMLGNAKPSAGTASAEQESGH